MRAPQGFIKVLKTGAYMKRYQVKYRRRREGKTDYQARRRMSIQDKNKYNSTRYRLCVRITNKDVICQFIQPKITGDHCMVAAYSHELPKYGVEVGLTNYAACYATGLLAARRLLKKLGLDDKYEGQEEPDGEMFLVEHDDGPRPFTCVLDVGLVRTTTGNRVFGALKGATDGGLDIPHNYKRFPGYDKESKEFDAEAMKDRIFGAHVSEYMEKLMDEDNAKYQQLFADYIKEGVEPDGMEDLYTSVHEAIREDPSPAEKEEFEVEDREAYKKTPKLTYEERKARVAAKKAEMEEDDEDDEDEDDEEEAEEAPKKADY